MATQTAPAKQDQMKAVRQQLGQMRPELQKALPAHVSVDKFERVVQTAINQQPDLMDCTRRSLFGACVNAAQDGLLPDGREGAIVSFYDKKAGAKLAQWMPMVAGVLKKVRNSGELSSISTQVVCRNDHFDYQLGDEEYIDHKPELADRGDIIAAYAIAKLKDGSTMREIMGRDEIERVRSVSKSKDNPAGPWMNWFGEMARKTVLRRLSKRLPMSTDLERVMHRDDPMYDPGGQQQVAAPRASASNKLDAFAAGPQPEPQTAAQTQPAADQAPAEEAPAGPAPDDTQDAEVVEDGETAGAVAAAESDLIGGDQQQTGGGKEANAKQAGKGKAKQQTSAADAGAPFVLTYLDLTQHRYDRQAAFETDLTAALQNAPDSDQAADLWSANQEEVQRLQQHAPEKAHAIFEAYQATQPEAE
ncbi:MAG: recombinase RecT [Rhodovibrio sp.]|nr:recombinase RecT [Rhodovibrio sp.]